MRPGGPGLRQDSDRSTARLRPGCGEKRSSSWLCAQSRVRRSSRARADAVRGEGCRRRAGICCGARWSRDSGWQSRLGFGAAEVMGELALRDMTHDADMGGGGLDVTMAVVGAKVAAIPGAAEQRRELAGLAAERHGGRRRTLQRGGRDGDRWRAVDRVEHGGCCWVWGGRW